KHLIFPPHSQGDTSRRRQQPTIISLMTKKETLTHQQLLERKLLRWVITDKSHFNRSFEISQESHSHSPHGLQFGGGLNHLPILVGS
ncbi:hypothetical protein V1527DRAFT_461605, partial [Lipomyces starkeyi]